jgi:hypothetical protein
MTEKFDRQPSAPLPAVRTITDATSPAQIWERDASRKVENSKYTTRKRMKVQTRTPSPIKWKVAAI